LRPDRRQAITAGGAIDGRQTGSPGGVVATDETEPAGGGEKGASGAGPVSLIGHRRILAIVGDMLQVELPPPERQVGETPRFGDLALVGSDDGRSLLAQIIKLDPGVASLQVFSGTRGLSTGSQVNFLGHPPEVTYSPNILGRVFGGDGRPVDGGPPLDLDPRISVGGPPANPARRKLAARMIRTDVPMIDLFNSLVESQKIPIFSVSGEPYNAFLARIGIQADADVVIFGGLGLIFDDTWFFRTAFEDAGVFARTVMFVNQASDPIVERLLVPDLALAVAERFAVDEKKRVLVLLTDMTAFADAMKQVGIAMERVPSNRGYMGDLYTRLAQRYEKACAFKGGGSITILSVTTMPGDDITHPVPDNTGYITEGQFYLHDGVLDPFGSLSRLKQHVIGKETREDHGQIMNTMIRFYAGAIDAEQKRAMAFELSEHDQQLLKFGTLFRERFMPIEVAMPLEDALDLAWATLAACFRPEQLLMRQDLIDSYLPRTSPDEAAA
jgi:V/A-type H+-transporting ATPase subunit B